MAPILTRVKEEPEESNVVWRDVSCGRSVVERRWTGRRGEQKEEEVLVVEAAGNGRAGGLASHSCNDIS